MVIDKAKRIKATVTVPMLLKEYGLVLDGRARRIPCPIHHGENNNFSVKRDFYKCFVCGAGGDVIDLAMQLENCDFLTACNKLDEMFGLGLDKPPTLTQYRRTSARQKEAKRLKAARECSAAQYRLLCAYNRWLLRQEQTEAIKNDIDYLGRTLDRYLHEADDNLIDWSAKDRIRALYSKHRQEGGSNIGI